MNKIAITMGEPGGIGPEIIVKSLYCAEIRNYCNPIIIGNAEVMRQAVKLTGLPLKVKSISNLSDSKPTVGRIEVIDIRSPQPFKKGVPSKKSGIAEVKYIKKVPRIINKKLVLKTIILAKKGTHMLGIKKPRIAVAGLNPHAGESGIFGREEIKLIMPAVQKAREEGIDVSGPYPPDVVFYKAYNGEFDIVVCMYHDQGLIPFKMLAFDTGVNVTVGLPMIRTSPDHGTGFDIAWKNKANPSSMIEAIKLAAKMELM